MISGKETLKSTIYSTCVRIPKLNGYFMLSGKNVTEMTINGLTLTRNGAWIKVSASTEEEVKSFLVQFQSKDKDINQIREISHVRQMSRRFKY